VKDVEIDTFLSKADAVQKAIKGMTDGTLRPEDVHVDGIKSSKEQEEEEVGFLFVCFVFRCCCTK